MEDISKQNHGHSIDLDNIDQDVQQFLTFKVDDEEYGIDILSVQEIRGWEPTTLVPNAPRFLKGVINLRGTIVPVIDLRLRFQLESIDYSDVTVVIIVKEKIGDGEKVMGMVVDAVSDVYNLSMDASTQVPDIGDMENKQYIKGLINEDDKMIILLDLKKILDI